MRPATLEAAEAARDALVAALGDLPELSGIGIALIDDGFGVKVNLSRSVPRGTVPDDVDGVPVVIAAIGTVQPL